MAGATDPRANQAAEERRFAVDDRHPTYGSAPPPQGFSGNNPQIGGGPAQGVVVTIPYLQEKSLCEAYLLCLPLGFLGFHHFYLRRYWFGFLYFFTGGLLGLGWLGDIVRLPWLVRDANQKTRRPPNEDVPQVNLVDAYLLWYPLGILGLHHYYLRRPFWGVAYTLSGGLFGIGWIIDAFRLPSLVRRTNDRLLLEHIERETRPEVFRVSLCDAYVLCLMPPLGILGAHHFYLRRYATGVFYLFTAGGCGVGWIVDWFRLKWLVERTNHPDRFPLGHRQKFVDDAYVYAFPMGIFGAHHFYLERPVWGFLYIFTGGLFGIGWLVDLCRMPCLVKDANWRTGHELAMRTAASDGSHHHLPHHQTTTSNVVIISQGTPGNSFSGTAYVGGPANYNNHGNNAPPAFYYPPPYQPLIDHPPYGNTSWVSVASQPSLPPPPGGFSANPPAYDKGIFTDVYQGT